MVDVDGHLNTPAEQQLPAGGCSLSAKHMSMHLHATAPDTKLVGPTHVASEYSKIH